MYVALALCTQAAKYYVVARSCATVGTARFLLPGLCGYLDRKALLPYQPVSLSAYLPIY